MGYFGEITQEKGDHLHLANGQSGDGRLLGFYYFEVYTSNELTTKVGALGLGVAPGWMSARTDNTSTISYLEFYRMILPHLVIKEGLLPSNTKRLPTICIVGNNMGHQHEDMQCVSIYALPQDIQAKISNDRLV